MACTSDPGTGEKRDLHCDIQEEAFRKTGIACLESGCIKQGCSNASGDMGCSIGKDEVNDALSYKNYDNTKVKGD